MKPREIAIVGSGSWGTALAILLSRAGHPIRLWSHSPELAAQLDQQRSNEKYLPGVPLPSSVVPTSNLADLRTAEIVLMVAPSKAVRELARQLAGLGMNSEAVWVSCTKGIEPSSGRLMTGILEEELGLAEAAVLSGPNFAREVACGEPSAGVIGARDAKLQEILQPVFSLPTFRAYTSEDSTGIQLGGALKNIYAIGAGCADGFRMGTNAKAALVTRCLAEMIRLGTALGGKRDTFSGLGGIGDLMATCFGEQSRNRQFGERLGHGESRADIEASTRTVAEGVPAALSAWQQARRLGVDTPVIDGVYAVLYQGYPPREILAGLLGRSPKAESA